MAVSAAKRQSVSAPEEAKSHIADIAATAKAYTRAGVWDERLFRLLAGAIKEEVRKIERSEINVRDVAELASAFSRMETRDGSTIRDGSLFLILSSHTKTLSCEQLCREPRALANIVNAFARAGSFD